jgi:hypothetical protein
MTLRAVLGPASRAGTLTLALQSEPLDEDAAQSLGLTDRSEIVVGVPSVVMALAEVGQNESIDRRRAGHATPLLPRDS